MPYSYIKLQLEAIYTFLAGTGTATLSIYGELQVIMSTVPMLSKLSPLSFIYTKLASQFITNCCSDTDQMAQLRYCHQIDASSHH